MSNFFILVPIYRIPTPAEQACLKQLLKIVNGNYLITVVYPKKLDTGTDPCILTNYLSTTCRYVPLDDKYFESTETYSYLLEENWFWSEMRPYEYVYIVQPDVWIFRDEFQYWVDKDFDYIGAPIVSNNANWINAPVVGNGGFSLRRISKFKEMTSQIFKNAHPDLLNNKWLCYEDLYFIQECGKYTFIDTPIVKEAVKFAIDMNPDVIYGNIKDMYFPFGVHAIDKNIPFWYDKIPQLNTEEIMNDCYNRNKAFIDAYYRK